jgi:pilus assembly protein CpaE
MPGKGACGASTLAANLAFQLKRLSSQKLLLADMDPLTGTVSFLLKLKSNYSFVDAAMHAHEMDEDIWKGLMSSCQGFDVLLSPENPAEAIAEAHDATALVDYSREGYELTVLDAQAPYGEWNVSLARACDELLLVTTNELPALHCTRRAINYLEQNGVERSKIKLIVNRYNPQAGLSREAIETALHADVYYVLPSDYEAVQRALMEGKPVPGSTALGKALSGLAERLTGRETKPRKTSLLSGLFSLFDTASS